jgi:hypothetical protein
VSNVVSINSPGRRGESVKELAGALERYGEKILGMGSFDGIEDIFAVRACRLSLAPLFLELLVFDCSIVAAW